MMAHLTEPMPALKPSGLYETQHGAGLAIGPIRFLFQRYTGQKKTA
jgi:hypothetical protein